MASHRWLQVFLGSGQLGYLWISEIRVQPWESASRRRGTSTCGKEHAGRFWNYNIYYIYIYVWFQTKIYDQAIWWYWDLPDGWGAVERCLENFFEKIGKVVGTHPVTRPHWRAGTRLKAWFLNKKKDCVNVVTCFPNPLVTRLKASWESSKGSAAPMRSTLDWSHPAETSHAVAVLRSKRWSAACFSPSFAVVVLPFWALRRGRRSSGCQQAAGWNLWAGIGKAFGGITNLFGSSLRCPSGSLALDHDAYVARFLEQACLGSFTMTGTVCPRVLSKSHSCGLSRSFLRGQRHDCPRRTTWSCANTPFLSIFCLLNHVASSCHIDVRWTHQRYFLVVYLTLVDHHRHQHYRHVHHDVHGCNRCLWCHLVVGCAKLSIMAR